MTPYYLLAIAIALLVLFVGTALLISFVLRAITEICSHIIIEWAALPKRRRTPEERRTERCKRHFGLS